MFLSIGIVFCLPELYDSCTHSDFLAADYHVLFCVSNGLVMAFGSPPPPRRPCSLVGIKILYLRNLCPSKATERARASAFKVLCVHSAATNSFVAFSRSHINQPKSTRTGPTRCSLALMCLFSARRICTWQTESSSLLHLAARPPTIGSVWRERIEIVNCCYFDKFLMASFRLA